MREEHLPRVLTFLSYLFFWYKGPDGLGFPNMVRKNSFHFYEMKALVRIILMLTKFRQHL